MVGEYGGHGFAVANHTWETKIKRSWGYGALAASVSELTDQYNSSIARLSWLRRDGIAAAVYTQLTDVEKELNGLMTYDRRVYKIPLSVLQTLNERAVVAEPFSGSCACQCRRELCGLV